MNSVAAYDPTEQQFYATSLAWLQDGPGGFVEVFVRIGNGGPVDDVGCTMMAKRADKCEPTDEVRIDHYISLAPEDAKGTKMYTFNMGPDAYVFGYEDRNDGAR